MGLGIFFWGHKYNWIVFKVEVDQCKVRNVSKKSFALFRLQGKSCFFFLLRVELSVLVLISPHFLLLSPQSL